MNEDYKCERVIKSKGETSDRCCACEPCRRYFGVGSGVDAIPDPNQPGVGGDPLQDRESSSGAFLEPVLVTRAQAGLLLTLLAEDEYESFRQRKQFRIDIGKLLQHRVLMAIEKLEKRANGE